MQNDLIPQSSRIAFYAGLISLLAANSVWAQTPPSALIASTGKVTPQIAGLMASSGAAVAVPLPQAPLGWDALDSQQLALVADFVIHVPDRHGLYLTAAEQNLIQKIQMSNPESVRADLIPLYVSLARQLYAGRLTPTEVSGDIRFTKKTLKEEVLQKIVMSPDASRESMVNALAPKLGDYKMLVSLYGNLKAIQAQGPLAAIPAFKKPLRQGSKDPAIPAIKERLTSYGFPITSMDDVFNDEMAAAVGDIQRQLKFTPDFVISPGGGTIKYLNTSVEARIDQVRADMEKLRWLPQNPGQKYIFVNLAFSNLVLMDHSLENPVVFNFKTINGRVERKTPSMVDKIYQVIMNPFWTVPPTVFIKDKVEMIKQMSQWDIDSWFDTNHFIVVDESFRNQYRPSSIDWHNITSANVGFYIRQMPNYYNALGVVKFSLTNGEAIYLHDTGERQLFGEENRLRSSGCVRVEKPLELAEYLLAGTIWDRYSIENQVARPGEVLDRETTVELKNSMPVYLLPVTSHLSSDGVMRFTDDVYGHNAAIKQQTDFAPF